MPRMDEKDKRIQDLIQEVAKWKGRAIEAANQACFECERLDKDCVKCRMTKIKEEAGK